MGIDVTVRTMRRNHGLNWPPFNMEIEKGISAMSSWTCMQMRGQRWRVGDETDERKGASSAKRNFRNLQAKGASFSSKSTFTSGTEPDVPAERRGHAENTQMVTCSTPRNDTAAIIYSKSRAASEGRRPAPWKWRYGCFTFHVEFVNRSLLELRAENKSQSLNPSF
ncbi:uncharacterized [Tachysurus ichikawai]